ncbi:MAG: Gfo/Idh/MocA family protein [Pseudonocardiaceae bacterium]
MTRIALIGTGNMGTLHARVIAQNDRSKLVRVIEPREEAGRAVADRWGADWSPELDSLSDVDGVVLASVTEMHRELALEVLRQEKPVLIEKPIASNLAHTKEILAVAAERDVPLMCGLVERYNPAVLTALALVDEPVHLTARRHSPYAPRISTGVAWDLLVHDVDIAIQFFGGVMPERVAAAAGYFHPRSADGAEDTVEALLSFGDGPGSAARACGLGSAARACGLATVSASRLGQHKVRSLVVSELERSVEIDLLRRDVTICRHVSHDAATPDGLGYRQQTIIEIPELISAREPLATQWDRFLDLMAGEHDLAAERASILPAHQVVAAVLAQSRQ